jgi:hypothetical protein
MSNFVIGDAIYQLVAFFILILMILFAVKLIRSFFTRRQKLESIEKKLDDIYEELEKKVNK